MLLRELAETLKITPPPAGDLPAGDPAAFDPETILRAAVAAGLAPELAEALRPAGRRLAADRDLAAYFAGLAPVLFGEELRTGTTGFLPEKVGVLSEPDEYAFFALLALSAAPTRERAFTAAGLPADSARSAVRDVGIWIAHFLRNRGFAGLSARILGWDYSVLNGTPLTLGRLQFVLKRFTEPLAVFRNTADGKVLALAADGERFNRGGVCANVDGEDDPEAWTAALTETEASVTGSPISPLGRAERRTVTLDKAVWRPVFRTGDWTIETHIPEDGPLDQAACGQAMRRAWDFFSRRHPDREIKSFSCLSWLLDPQYETILQPGSRIVAFMRQYYLFPIAESGADALWRVFGEDGMKHGLAAAPRNTGMQRRVADFLERGGKLRSGGGFLLPEELPLYGSEPYRRALEK